MNKSIENKGQIKLYIQYLDNILPVEHSSKTLARLSKQFEGFVWSINGSNMAKGSALRFM